MLEIPSQVLKPSTIHAYLAPGKSIFIPVTMSDIKPGSCDAYHQATKAPKINIVVAITNGNVYCTTAVNP
jgi:hypothetical protein